MPATIWPEPRRFPRHSRALSATEIAQLASTHAAPDITSGLIHWWKFDEAPGATTAVDTVGGANAPLSGTAAFTTSGYFNNGLNLPDDTTPKAATVTTPADMLGQSKLTESMWFKLATPGIMGTGLSAAHRR